MVREDQVNWLAALAQTIRHFMRIREIRKSARVLLTTVASQEVLGERLVREGANGIVYKPYKSAALLQAVRKALDKAS